MNAVTGFLSKQMNDPQFRLLIESLRSKLNGQDALKIEMANRRLMEGEPITPVPAAPRVPKGSPIHYPLSQSCLTLKVRIGTDSSTEG